MKFFILVITIITISLMLLFCITQFPALANPYLRYTLVTRNGTHLTYDNVKEGRFFCGINADTNKYSCIKSTAIVVYWIELR